VKAGQWPKKTKENLESLFAKHVLPVIGSHRMRDVTLTSLQLLVNKWAEDGYSKSVVAQIRTYPKACFMCFIKVTANCLLRRMSPPPTST
jgi:hypothetical protein